MKTLEGLQQVGVIVRGVDENLCDTLELVEDTFLGVAGLVEATRSIWFCNHCQLPRIGPDGKPGISVLSSRPVPAFVGGEFANPIQTGLVVRRRGCVAPCERQSGIAQF